MKPARSCRRRGPRSELWPGSLPKAAIKFSRLTNQRSVSAWIILSHLQASTLCLSRDSVT